MDQLVRLRAGESDLASKLLADGHSIVDVLLGSEDIGHLIESPASDNRPTVSQLKEAVIDNLQATGRTPGQIDGIRGYVDHFIRVLDDVRVMILPDAEMTAFQYKAWEREERRGRKKERRRRAENKPPRKKSSLK